MRHRFAFTTVICSLVLPTAAAGQDPGRLSLDSLLATPVSSSAKYSQTITEAAGAVSLITAAEIEAYGYRSFEQILATVRGLYLSYDRNYTYVGARGFSRPTDYNNRILLLVDGHLMNEGVWGTAPLGPEGGIDVESIERIEIVRGPSSALYGTGALLGVLNVITRGAEAGSGGHLSVEAGGLGTLATSGRINREVARGVRLSLSGFASDRNGDALYYPEFDAVDHGIVRDLDWERRAGVAGELSAGGLTLHGRYSSRTKGIPTASYGMTFGDRRARTRDDYGFVELKYERPVGSRLHLGGRAYYDRYWYTGDYPFDGAVSDEAGANDRIGAEALARWDLRSDNRLTVGTEIRRHVTARYYSPRTSAPTFDIDVPYTLVSIFAQDEFQVTSRLALIGGIRHDNYTTTGGATTPRLGAVFDASRNTTFKLLYGEGFRAPNLYEAEAETDSYRRNPNLRPERIATWELIWQQRFGAGILGTASVYDQRLRGLIDLTADTSGTATTYIYRNVADARSTGVELGLDVRLGERLQGYASYSAQRAVDEHRDRLTNSPTHQLRLGTAATFHPSLRGALQLRHESRRRTVYDTWTLPATVTDAHLEVGPFRSLRGVALSIRVDNLFDVAWATPGGVEHVQPAIEQDGRLISFRLGYRF